MNPQSRKAMVEGIILDHSVSERFGPFWACYNNGRDFETLSNGDPLYWIVPMSTVKSKSPAAMLLDNLTGEYHLVTVILSGGLSGIVHSPDHPVTEVDKAIEDTVREFAGSSGDYHIVAYSADGVRVCENHADKSVSICIGGKPILTYGVTGDAKIPEDCDHVEVFYKKTNVTIWLLDDPQCGDYIFSSHRDYNNLQSIAIGLLPRIYPVLKK